MTPIERANLEIKPHRIDFDTFFDNQPPTTPTRVHHVTLQPLPPPSPIRQVIPTQGLPKPPDTTSKIEVQLDKIFTAYTEGDKPLAIALYSDLEATDPTAVGKKVYKRYDSSLDNTCYHFLLTLTSRCPFDILKNVAIKMFEREPTCPYIMYQLAVVAYQLPEDEMSHRNALDMICMVKENLLRHSEKKICDPMIDQLNLWIAELKSLLD